MIIYLSIILNRCQKQFKIKKRKKKHNSKMIEDMEKCFNGMRMDKKKLNLIFKMTKGKVNTKAGILMERKQKKEGIVKEGLLIAKNGMRREHL